MSLRWSFGSAFVLALAGAGVAQGCSASSPPGGNGTGGFGNTPQNTGGLSANGGTNTAGSGGVSPSGSGGLIGVGLTNNGGKKPNDCGKLVQPAETIFVDASYTDTITTPAPIALFVMVDRSSSMVGVAGDPTSWPNLQNALNAFVADPASAGIDIGLGSFPPMSNQMGDCAGGTDCGTPIVPIAPLPGNAAAITSGLVQATPPFIPIFTPTECGLRGMINRCVEHTAQASMQCVAILITDGAPTQCNLDQAALVSVVTEGKTKGVTTFALSLPGSNRAFLDQLAQAGGTNAALVIEPGASGQQQFIQALNNIRGTVTKTSTTVVSRPVSTPLPCQFTIPLPQDGKPFDKDKTDVEFQPPAGAPPRSFKFVASEAACAGNNEAWYYDDPQDPKQVFLCPTTCDMVKGNAGASINIAFLCEKRDTT